MFSSLEATFDEEDATMSAIDSLNDVAHNILGGIYYCEETLYWMFCILLHLDYHY